MALLDTLAGELLGPKSIGELSKSTGASKEQVQQLVTSALPLLLSGMYQNSTTNEGAQSLDKALNDHAPAAEKSTSAMLRKADAKDGAKIVKHILGDNEKEIKKGLSNSTGLSQMQVSSALSLLAPVLLSLVGNHKNEEAQTQSASPNLASLLGTALLGNGYQQTQPAQQSGLNLMSLAGSLLGASSQQQQTAAQQTATQQKPKKPKKPKQEQQEEQPQQSSGVNLSGLLMGLLK